LIASLADALARPAGDFNGAARSYRMETAHAGIDAVFVDEVARQLLPGRAAIVAEIEEESQTATDAFIESHRGVVLRYVRRESTDTEIAHELSALHDAIQALQKRLESPAEPQAELQEGLELAKARFQAAKARARQHAASIKREAEAKIIWLQERAAKADAQAKTRFDRFADRVRVGYVNRATKLNLAWRFAGEVFPS
jgi:hypothetical protein